MKLTFLGTGTSSGVPVLGCKCPVCLSEDSKDKRLRTSALLETKTTRILIDCGPDVRMQLLRVPFRPLNGVLLTHFHYDHVGGIDDLRPFGWFGPTNIYTDDPTINSLKKVLPYCFAKDLYPGVPNLVVHSVKAHRSFCIGDIEILPINVMHGKMQIIGFRFGELAYITDMKTISRKDEDLLCGVKVLVVNALRFEKEHHSHQLVSDAINFSKRIGAKHTYFTHLTHYIGLHNEAQKKVPSGFFFAYDGLAITI